MWIGRERKYSLVPILDAVSKGPKGDGIPPHLPREPHDQDAHAVDNWRRHARDDEEDHRGEEQD